MPVDTEILIAAGAGFVFGFLVGWLVGLSMKEKKQKAEKKELSPEAVAFLHKEPYEYFDVHVAHVDVERQALIGVMHHIDDLVEELKGDGELHHLLRLVILGYEGEGESLTANADLCQHFLKIHEQRPYLPVFLEAKSMQLYLQFLIKGRKQTGAIPEHPVEPPIEKLEQEVVQQTTQLLTSQFSNRPEIMSRLLDMLLGRLEQVCDQMQRAEQARLNAALQSTP